MKKISACLKNILLCIVIMVNTAVPLMTVSADGDMTIRVSWSENGTVQYIDGIGIKRGYAYDCMEEIANYMNAGCNYIKCSREESMEGIKNGDIDVVPFVKKSEEKSRFMDFSYMPVGEEYAVLSALKTNSEIVPRNYYTYNGKTVGCIKETELDEKLKVFMEENNFLCDIRYYNSLSELEQALNSGDIDFMLYNDYRMIGSGEVVLSKFMPEYTYIGVRKDSGKLLEQINSAISDIGKVCPEFKEKLKNKYLLSYKTDLSFTKEEMDYIHSINTISVILPVERGYMAEYDNGACNGVDVDIINRISDITGLKFDFVPVRQYDKLEEASKSSRHFITAGYYYDYAWANSQRMDITLPYAAVQYYILTNDKLGFDEESGEKVAAVKATNFVNSYLGDKYGYERIVQCETAKECLDAVRTGKVGAAYIDSLTAEYYLRMYKYSKLRKEVIPFEHELCYATETGTDIRLITVLNKAISMMGSDYVNTVVLNNTSHNYSKMGFLSFVREYKAYTVTVIGLIVILIAAAVVMICRIRSLKNKNVLLQNVSRNKYMFLYNMSHEVLTPMNGIIGMLNILKTNITDNNSKYIENALESSKQLRVFLKEIFDMARMSNDDFEFNSRYLSVLKLEQKINTVIAPFAKDRDVDFVSEVDCGEYKYICIDAERIIQVLVNLLDNAIRYTRMGGRVKYSIKLESIEPNKAAVRFKIEDSGIGMDKKLIEDICDSFENENPNKYDGRNLGIAVSNKIVNMMGSKLEYESELGKGTTVSFTIIANVSDTCGSENEISVDTEDIGIFGHRNEFNNKRILVVEDNEINMEIAEFQFVSLGFAVDKAYDGEEAIYMFRSSGENYYDVIFMDITMPNKDGYETTREIRAISRNDAKYIPIVAMTANASAEDDKEVKEAGMNYCLVKPFSADEAISVLNRIFRDYH